MATVTVSHGDEERRDLDDTLSAFKAKSGAFYAIARPWVDAALKRILKEDAMRRGATWDDFEVVVASDREDLEFVTDYRATLRASHVARVAFRGRDVARSSTNGRAIRQMTLRKAGAVGHREYDKVFDGGHGDYYVTCWVSGMVVEAAVIVDLWAFRQLPPVIRRRMEHDAMSNVPFVGYDAAALIAHDLTRAVYPDLDYFTQHIAEPQIRGQEALL